MSEADPKAALVDECQRQVENCAYTATSFTIWLRALRYFRIAGEATPIAFGALATCSLLASLPVLSGTCILLATAIPPVYRKFRLDEGIKQYTFLAGEMTNLRDRFRYTATIDSHKALAEFEAAVRPLLDRLEKARGRAAAPPEWCFTLARKKHKQGHYAYDYDQARQSLTQAPTLAE
jgi:hypothetical protein